MPTLMIQRVRWENEEQIRCRILHMFQTELQTSLLGPQISSRSIFKGCFKNCERKNWKCKMQKTNLRSRKSEMPKIPPISAIIAVQEEKWKGCHSRPRLKQKHLKWQLWETSLFNIVSFLWSLKSWTKGSNCWKLALSNCTFSAKLGLTFHAL